MQSMGQGGGSGPLGMFITRWVKRLMIATAAASILGGIALRWLDMEWPGWLVLTPAAVWGGALGGIPAVWQLVTYPFLVFDPIGLLFAILIYGWFAGYLEAWWGSQRFLWFFGTVTIGAAVLTTLLALVWPSLSMQTFAGPYPVIDGLIVAWGLSFPDREIRLFFVLPVKGIHLVYLTLGLLGLYIIFSGSVAPFVAQLFGIGIAALVVTGAWRPRKLWLRVRRRMIERQIAAEQEQRRRRVEKSHLRVIDEDPDEAPARKNGDPTRKNGDAGQNGSGGWLH